MGEAARLHRVDEVSNESVPGIRRDPTMDIAVGNDLDIAFAERNEEQHAVAVVGGTDNADGEFAVSEPPRMAVLDRWRDDPQAQRQQSRARRRVAKTVASITKPMRIPSAGHSSAATPVTISAKTAAQTAGNSA